MNFETLPRFKPQSIGIVSMVSEWAAAYEVDPTVIESQIRVAHAWCNANPKRAPKRDVLRFLNNWMRLARKMGNLNSRKRESYSEAKPAESELITADDWAKLRESLQRGGITA